MRTQRKIGTIFPQETSMLFFTSWLFNCYYLRQVIGEDRVITGSDYPFPLGEHSPGLLVNSSTRLSQAVKDKILFQNAADFLNLDLSRFK